MSVSLEGGVCLVRGCVSVCVCLFVCVCLRVCSSESRTIQRAMCQSFLPLMSRTARRGEVTEVRFKSYSGKITTQTSL